MSSIFDSMIPSRRREQKRLREEANRLNERWGDAHISAPNNGCWIGGDQAPELEWSSPSTQGFASPDVPSTLAHNSPELGEYGEQVIIVDTDAEPVAHPYHDEAAEKNAITFTIPLPWASRKAHSRSPSAGLSSHPVVDTHQRNSPAVVYKPTSDQYLKDLGDLSRGNSPTPSAVSSARNVHQQPIVDLPLRQASPQSSFARRSPSPPVEQEGHHQISAIMLLSPVVEDFPIRPPTQSTFSRAASQRNVSHFTQHNAFTLPERPSTAMSSTSAAANARSEVSTSVSRATGITDASFHTAITHHTTRSASRGPGLAHTGTMRSASRDPTTRRAMSREPSERRALSREPTSDRRAMSREPVNRRAMSREPARRRAMTGDEESLALRRGTPSLDDLRHHHHHHHHHAVVAAASSRSGRTSIESESSSDEAVSEVGRKVSNSGSATHGGGGYYASMVDEYRHIAWEGLNVQQQHHTSATSDSDSLVGRVGKLARGGSGEKGRSSKERERETAMPPHHAAVLSRKDMELVPSGADLYS